MAGGARRIVVEFIGDGKNLSGELNDLQGKTGKFGSFMKSAGKAAAYGLGAGLVVAGGAAVKFAQAAADDQQQALLMAKTFKNAANATDEQVAATERWIAKQGLAKGVADDELRPALSKLITATHDVGEAQKLATLAMDVSAGSGKSLETVTTALMKAQNGQVSALGRLGIKVTDSVKDEAALQAANISLTSAQQSYTDAVKDHGAKSEEAQAAAAKLEYAQTKLGEAQGKAKKVTVDFTEATQRMTDLYGGAASTKAETFQGKMDRLKLMMSETGEAIGYKLIPVLTNLMDWVQGEGVPAVEEFFHEWQKGEGTAGDVRDVLEKVGVVVKKVGGFLIENKTIVATAIGAYVGYRAAVATATAVQWAMNAAMTANPIGLVVVALAALTAGLVIAYKKSDTFRDVIDTTFSVAGKIMRSFWNDFAQPILHLLVEAIASAAEGFADMLDGLSHVPGFGWVKGAADGLHKAADQGHAFADSIRQIPATKDVTITVHVNQAAINKVQQQLGNLTPRGGSGGAGGSKFDKKFGLGQNDVGGAGSALIGSIVDGIRKGRVPLQKALDDLGEYIKKHQDKLKDLLSKRDSIVDAFRGMTSNLFGTDVSPGEDGVAKTIQTLLDAGAARKANAQALGANVQSLLDKGLSRDLLRQMIDAGEAGAQQIALLASGTQAQIEQANADNDATRTALEKAGLAVGDAIYGTQIKQEEQAIKNADMIRDKLAELLDLQDKNTIVELHLDGHVILASLKKIKRQNGGHLGLGDSDGP